MGDFVNVFFEGEKPEAVMAGMAGSSNEFDKWFAGKVLELHGIDVSKPPPGPMAEVVLDIST